MREKRDRIARSKYGSRYQAAEAQLQACQTGEIGEQKEEYAQLQKEESTQRMKVVKVQKTEDFALQTAFHESMAVIDLRLRERPKARRAQALQDGKGAKQGRANLPEAAFVRKDKAHFRSERRPHLVQTVAQLSHGRILLAGRGSGASLAKGVSTLRPQALLRRPSRLHGERRGPGEE